MEEYEVDLRDYFRILWRQKWVVLAVFVLAVALAAAVSWMQPDEFQTSARIEWDTEIPLSNPALDVLSLGVLTDLMQQSRPSGTSLSTENVQGTPFQVIRLDGPLPPQQLVQTFDQLLRDTQARLEALVQEEIQRGIDLLTQRRRSFDEQRSRWVGVIQQWIDQRQENVRQQRDALSERLQRALASLEGAPNASVQPASLLIAYSSLSERIAELEGELANLELERSANMPQPSSPWDSRLAEIHSNSVQLEIARDEYQQLAQWIADGAWTPLAVVQAPSVDATRIVGPRRTMNVAIAGVLGLFVGMLLAFFVHYMRGS